MTTQRSLHSIAHQAITARLAAGDWAIDGTVGNGHDTLLLAQTVGPTGRILGFDLQAQAIAAAQARLTQANAISQVTLLQQGHESIAEVLSAENRQNSIKAAMFNFGYLPGSDKTLITQTQTSLTALQAALTNLTSQSGILSAMLYPGHPGGKEEADAILSWAQTLNHTHYQIEHHTSASNKGPQLLLISR